MTIVAFSVVLYLLQSMFLPTATQEIHASYRKDFFYSYDRYPEADLPDPVDGGRFHLVTTSSADGTPGQVTLNGQVVTFPAGQDPDTWFVDWMHVYPPTLSKGEPVWISLHTRSKKFDRVTSSSIELLTSDGSVAVKGTFDVMLNLCNITYVTTTAEYDKLLIHVHNGYTTTRTIHQVLINGSNVTGSVVNSMSLSVPPLSSTMLTIPLSTPVAPGNLYTVVLQYAESGAGESVAGGRLAKTHFPIESWPKSQECPFPTVNDHNYQWHRDHGIDTLFFGMGAAKPCGSQVSGSTIAGQLAPQHGFYCLIGSDIPPKTLQNSSNVLGVLLADEADDKLDDGIRKLMNQTLSLWQDDSSLLAYCGGSRSRRNGIFAGVTDIQGMDMYIAACAPHVQEFLHPPPPRGSYDYLRLTRNNHMPLSTWTYSQLLDDGWDSKIGNTVLAHRQPNPDEARIQAMSVIAACAKGLMYFQSEVAENKYYPQTWVEIGNFNKDIGAVRKYLREGDCTDMVTSSDGDGVHAESIVQAIRSSEAILVPVINLKNDGGYNDEGCAVGLDLHWKFKDHTVDLITVTIPSDFGTVVDMFEVRNGAIYNITNTDIQLEKDLHGGKAQQVKISNVALSPELATRLFVLSNTKQVRTDVQNNLHM